MYFAQQWYGLAGEAVEGAIYDSQALRNFMSIDWSRQRVRFGAYTGHDVVERQRYQPGAGTVVWTGAGSLA